MLTVSGVVWQYVDNHSILSLPCSNHDKKFYRKHFHVSTDSSPDPKEHLMGPKTPGHYPHEVSHGVMYTLLMGVATVPLVRGTMGCLGEVEDCRQACTRLVVLATNILKH